MSRNSSPALSPSITSPSLPPLPASPLSPLSAIESNESVFRPSSLDPIIEHVQAEHTQPILPARKGSISSVRFKDSPRASRSPRESGRRSSIGSRRLSPPPPAKFKGHVSFENFGHVKATERNTISVTLNSKHTGYHWTRRSRTFMVGIDDKSYSDVALRWMLDELVDDGDTIICLRVKERETVAEHKASEYKQLAKEILAQIQERNEAHRAISIVLEFAVGDLHPTFEKMIQLHEPAMLIVGTKGKSLQGVQGLLGGRTSFSKWCLQYSPIPVVVVRSVEQRGKKKIKRDRDPQRGDYIRMLRESGLEVHESETVAKSNIFEAPNTPDVEAHAVISALGLPENFVPTFKPLAVQDEEARLKDIAIRAAIDRPSEVTLIGDSQPNSPSMAAIESPESDSGSDSDSDDSGNEFEAIDARALLQNAISEEERKKKLHQMKLEEARSFAANAPKSLNGEAGTEVVRKVSVESVDSVDGAKRSHDDDEDDDELLERVRGERKASLASTTSTSSDMSRVSEKRIASRTYQVEGDEESIISSNATLGNLLQNVGSKDSNSSDSGEGIGSSNEISEDSLSPRLTEDDPFAKSEFPEVGVVDGLKDASEDMNVSPGTVKEDPIEEAVENERADPTITVSEERGGQK